MFEDEIVIGSIRAQADRLKRIVGQLESDQGWKDNSLYYATLVHDVEKSLKKIRKLNLAHTDKNKITV